MIAYRDLDGDPHGINAKPVSGADLTLYQQGASYRVPSRSRQCVIAPVRREALVD